MGTITASVTEMSPSRGDTRTPPPVLDEAGTAPPGWEWRVLVRRSLGDPWAVLYSAATAEQAWLLMCNAEIGVTLRPLLVRVDPPEPAAG